MSSKVLECPKEIFVGISSLKWEDNPLAYVTYKTKTGKISKEVSFNKWCGEKSPRKTFENTPQEGFKVLFNVGGCKSGWNVRQTYFRVVDPRGFEFEIVADNFVEILQNSIINKGVIDGKYAYGWYGQNLLLVRGDDPRYLEGVKSKDTELSAEKVTKENIKIGQAYRLRDHKLGYYIGRFNWHGYNNPYHSCYSHPRVETWTHVETLMYSFICPNEDYDKSTYKWKIVGYKEIKNVKFALEKFISEQKALDAANIFKDLCYGDIASNIKFPIGKNDSWAKKYHPEQFESYDTWIKKPYINEDGNYPKRKFHYNTRRFFFEKENELDMIISFKFKDGSIKNFLFNNTKLSEDHLSVITDDIVDNVEISESQFYGKDSYWYGSGKQSVSHYTYECYYVHNYDEWQGDVTKLIPEMGNTYFMSSEWEIQTKYGKCGFPLDIKKAYERVGVPKGIWKMD